ncbi:uncharacterized protein LOC114516415 [Dendronephthya gigantea]|uniref:uncharacterized protein LOC114516415 n=1 Tax=Dendronephthya gigantea TaxID=151771 RepID=UPI00106D8557|nr:uncharacterized protein LOC114516415 [Dendronephthya gigantea]
MDDELIRALQVIEDCELAQALANWQREVKFGGYRRPKTSDRFGDFKIKWQVKDDYIFAQEIAESQRGEIQKRSPCQAVNWSRHELPPVQRPYSRVASRSNFLDSDYWLRYAQTPYYLRPDRPFKQQDHVQLPEEQTMIPQEIHDYRSPAITHELVNQYINHCNMRCDRCRRVMQKARVMATEVEEKYRKSFEMRCYAEHFCLVFWSGDRKNTCVIQMDGDEVLVKVTNESWSKWLKRVAEKCWSGFKFLVEKGCEILKGLGPLAPLVCLALPL